MAQTKIKIPFYFNQSFYYIPNKYVLVPNKSRYLTKKLFHQEFILPKCAIYILITLIIVNVYFELEGPTYYCYCKLYFIK